MQSQLERCRRSRAQRARVVVEKESTGRHVLLRVSSDRRGRSDRQSEPSKGPYAIYRPDMHSGAVAPTEQYYGR